MKTLASTDRLPPESPLAELRRALATGDATLAAVAEDCLEHANASASQNTYIEIDRARLMAEAAQPAPGPLHGVPVSLKDCFDLAGTRTTFGSRFYAEHNPVVQRDSAVAERLRGAGALITGKTHLHPLAYGITGQNADFGDCLQPQHPALLTGGSSSGAAASVQEGSALAAIGTDTGGSIRVPAALCGLTGYRASHAMAAPGGLWPDMWRGSMALAPSFDTLGLIFRDPRDAEPLARALFQFKPAAPASAPRIGCAPLEFLDDSSAEVLDAYARWKMWLTSTGAALRWIDPAPWSDAVPIFTAIQAHEAAQIHAGHFDEFGPLIAQRLHWGASIDAHALAALRQRHAGFRAGLASLFDEVDFLLLPVAPVARLNATEDQSTMRTAILRYTAPFSLGGLPIVSLPGPLVGGAYGTGVQLAAAPAADAALLALVTTLAHALQHRPLG